MEGRKQLVSKHREVRSRITYTNPFTVTSSGVNALSSAMAFDSASPDMGNGFTAEDAVITVSTAVTQIFTVDGLTVFRASSLSRPCGEER